MKDSKIYAKKIAKLYREIKKTHGKVKVVEYDDPIEAMVFGTLCEHQNFSAARTSLRKINRHFVDLNDLRVSRPEELIEILGGHGKEIDAIAYELSESLNAIFYKFDSLDLAILKELGKRQARKELEELEKITSFAVSYCFLTAFGGHAIPVSKSMADYLRVEGLVHPKANEQDIEGFLERQNKSEDAYDVFALLKTHSDVAAKKTQKKLAEIEAKKAPKKAAKKTKVKKAKKEEIPEEDSSVKQTKKKVVAKKVNEKVKTAAKKTSEKTVKAEKKATKKATKKAVKKDAKQTEKKAAKKVAKSTAKKVEKKVVKKTVKKAEKKTVKKSAKKVVKKTAKKSAKKS